MFQLTNCSAKLRRASRERGVFAPLLAIIAVALVYVLITYGLDSSTVRQASKALEKYNEQVCREVMSRPVIHRDAIESFRRQIQRAADESLIPNVKLLGANLTLPTMPSAGDFDFAGGSASDPYVVSIRNFGDFECQGVAGCLKCNICVGANCQDCQFSGNVNTAASFPASLWNNLENAGNTGACELKGSVKTVLYGDKELVARTVWAATVRGSFPSASGAASTNPGISLVVAPQLQSRAGDPRFRFSTDSAFFDSVFRSSYDPLYSFSKTGSAPGVNAFLYSPGSKIYPAALAVPTATNTPGATPTNTPSGGPPGPTPLPTVPWEIESLKLPSSDCRADLPGGGCAGGSNLPQQERELIGSDYGSYPDCMGYPTPQPGTNCMVLSDREELLAACMNPPVLVRNMITSTILELAMRHGELRNMTEVLIANPCNRNEKAPAYVANNPVRVIGHGEDLAARSYQLPFVFFHGGGDIYGNDSDLPNGTGHEPDYRPHLFGVVNPFNQSHHQIAALPSAEQDQIDSILPHHRLLANQLRICYHLFHGRDEQALARYDIPGLVNDEFEPNSSTAPKEAYAFDSALRSPYPNAPDGWDQEFPWGGGAPVKTRGLNGPELVSVLGSVQLCPYYEAGLPSPPFPTPQPTPTPPVTSKSGICLKPNNPENDLRGDLLGALCYLKGSESSNVCPAAFGSSPADVFPAINEPGLFPLLNPHAANPVFDGVNYNELYGSAVNTHVPIVLVTHQPLNSKEKHDIRRLIDEGHFNHRPITVIFVQAWEKPAESDVIQNQRHLENEIIADFRSAFDIPLQFRPNQPVAPGNRDNALFVFSPYTVNTGFALAIGTLPSQAFSQYWKFLLDGSHDENIHVAATNIFYNRILRVMLNL